MSPRSSVGSEHCFCKAKVTRSIRVVGNIVFTIPRPKKLSGVSIEYMKNVFFWTSFVIGFVAILLLYIQKKDTEGFTSFTQDLEEFANFYEGPYLPENINNLIYVYMSSFSDVTSDNITPTYAAGGSAYWRDLKEGKELFNIIGTNLPSTLRSPPDYGLSMMGVRMIGPPSENLAFPNSGYVLPSLSVCFFGKWKTVDIQSPLVLYRMYAETPNAITISFIPLNNENVTLSIVLGDVNKKYDWTVPKTTLLTQSMGTLYSFIYDKDANTLTAFVGTTSLGSQNLSEKPSIKLSNSPIEIAYTQNWDFVLQSLLLCRGVINPADIVATTDYFVGLSNGKTQEVAQLQQQTTTVKKSLETCSSKLPRLLAEIENLKGEVQYSETELKDLKKKLEREKLACAKAAAGETKFQWLIKNGKCPEVRTPPKGINEFPHLISKKHGGLVDAPKTMTPQPAVTISPPTTTGTFKHAIAPIGSAEQQSWLQKWIPSLGS
jgi:hypothetical protein